MWTLVIISLTTPFMQSEFATSDACVKGFTAARSAASMTQVQQAYCTSATATPVWIIRDGKTVSP